MLYYWRAVRPRHRCADGVRILIIGGGSGYLGLALTRQCGRVGIDAIPTAFTRAAPSANRLDLRDPEALKPILVRTEPDAVINTASGIGDWGVTAIGAAHIARICARENLRLLHVIAALNVSRWIRVWLTGFALKSVTWSCVRSVSHLRAPSSMTHIMALAGLGSVMVSGYALPDSRVR